MLIPHKHTAFIQCSHFSVHNTHSIHTACSTHSTYSRIHPVHNVQPSTHNTHRTLCLHGVMWPGTGGHLSSPNKHDHLWPVSELKGNLPMCQRGDLCGKGQQLAVAVSGPRLVEPHPGFPSFFIIPNWAEPHVTSLRFRLSGLGSLGFLPPVLGIHFSAGAHPVVSKGDHFSDASWKWWMDFPLPRGEPFPSHRPHGPDVTIHHHYCAK